MSSNLFTTRKKSQTPDMFVTNKTVQHGCMVAEVEVAWRSLAATIGNADGECGEVSTAMFLLLCRECCIVSLSSHDAIDLGCGVRILRVTRLPYKSTNYVLRVIEDWPRLAEKVNKQGIRQLRA